MALCGLSTKYMALNLQVRLRGEVVIAHDFQSLEHYMRTMVRAPLVPGKLNYFFKMETSVSCHEF